jgi:hypothetical protein
MPADCLMVMAAKINQFFPLNEGVISCLLDEQSVFQQETEYFSRMKHNKSYYKILKNNKCVSEHECPAKRKLFWIWFFFLMRELSWLETEYET